MYFVHHNMCKSQRASVAVERLALLPEVLNLFEVVAAVHPMEFSPLASGQGSENRMIEQPVLLAKAGFTLRNRFVHGGDARPDFASDLLRRHPAG